MQYSSDRSGVWQGHYFETNCAEAKQDLAVRAGLIPEHKLFKNEKWVVFYDSCVFRGKSDDEKKL